MLKPYKEALTDVTTIVYDYVKALEETLKNGETSENLYKLDIKKLDEKVVEILALYNPQGEYLRDVIAYLKLSSFLVKLKSNIESFNRKKTKLEENPIITALYKNAITSMEYLSVMLENCDNLDVEYANIISQEKIADDLYNELYLSLKDKEETEKVLYILDTAKKLEKITDNAKTIAHYIMFACQGSEI